MAQLSLHAVVLHGWAQVSPGLPGMLQVSRSGRIQHSANNRRVRNIPVNRHHAVFASGGTTLQVRISDDTFQ